MTRPRGARRHDEQGGCPGGTPAEAGSPIDQRDREVIAGTLAETVFAVAGAGSGKTRHLVERVCKVLLTGRARMEGIAVITFTEAAAAELRERVAEELEKSATDTDAVRARRAVDALASLDASAITTLHGFARRILSAHPFDAALPPTFEVMDEARSLADLDEHWVESVDALLEDAECARAVQWTIVAGGDLGKLRAIVRRMGEHWDRLDAVAQAGRPPLPQVDAASIVAPLERALSLSGACDDPEDALLAHVAALSSYVARLEEGAHDELQLLGLVVHPPTRLSCRAGDARVWRARKQEVVDLLRQAEDARRTAARAAVGAALRVVGVALARVTVDAARRRRQEGRLQYHDLLVLACELVRERPDVRAALHAEYPCIFVDEYQDTDPLQAELVAMIAATRNARPGETPWWELETTPGALFFVGDPLQSIYAFRRADVRTFFLTLEKVATRRAQLVTNFRSAPGVVEWVNEVFASIVGDGNEGLQPGFVRSVAARAAGDGPRPSVTVLRAPDPRPGTAAESRRAEAEEVAALLRRAVAEGWPVGRGGRPLELDDVVVLLPSRTALPALEEAFDAEGLDYRLESSSLVYDAPEVRELLTVLRAVDDPSDSASVVGALRSPGLGCGDDDLFAFRLAGGSWDYRSDPPLVVASTDPVRLALERLRALHEARTWSGVSEVVARVVAELRQLEAALDGPRWREEWRRLRFVVDQARQFAESSPGTLREYLAWVDVQRDEDAKVTEVVLPEADAPAVSVMTVHAAKGLEFPMVAVVGLGTAPQGVRGPTVLFGDDGGIELAINKDVCTDGYEVARDREQEVLTYERVRLLYVAVTRAQNHLVVSVHRSARSGATTAAVLEGAIDAVALRAPEVSPAGLGLLSTEGSPSRLVTRAPASGPAAAGRRGVGADSGGAPDTPEALERWLAERSERLSALPQVVSATAVAKRALAGVGRRSLRGPGVDGRPSGSDGEDAGAPDADVDDQPIAARAVWRRGRAGTAVGRAVHAVLQGVDLRSKEPLEALARVHAGAEGVPSRWSEIAALAGAALASPTVREAAAGRFWRELYVAAPFGSGVVEGFVDLLFEGREGLEVVDYKTDQVTSDAEIDRLVERYRLQGAAYAAAVQSAIGRPVVRCTLLFLRGRTAVARSMPDLASAVGEVERIVAGA